MAPHCLGSKSRLQSNKALLVLAPARLSSLLTQFPTPTLSTSAPWLPSVARMHQALNLCMRWFLPGLILQARTQRSPLPGRHMTPQPHPAESNALFPPISHSFNQDLVSTTVSQTPGYKFKRLISTCVFIAALFTIAKREKQPRSPSKGEIDKFNMVHPYNGLFITHS